MSELMHPEIRTRLTHAIERLLVDKELLVPFYPHQRTAYERMLDWLREREAGHRAYISHATGMGKTYHFLALVCEAIKEGLKSIIIVPSRMLAAQTVRKIYEYTGGKVSVGHISSLPSKVTHHKKKEIVYATKDYEGKDIVVIVQQSLPNWAAKLATEFCPHFVVRDEMHWGYTPAQLAALEHFSEAAIVGYSATPDYLTTVKKKKSVAVELENGNILYCDPKKRASTYFGECLHRVGLREGIGKGILASLAYGQIDLRSISLDDVPTVDGPMGLDYDPISLAKHLEANWDLVMEVVEELYKTNEYNICNIPVVAICPSVATAERFAAMVSKYTQAASVTGGTPSVVREGLFARFEMAEDDEETKALRSLSAVYVTREGWDSKSATLLLMLRATKSYVFYMQVLGRILRKYLDKIAVALDPLFQYTKFSPLSLPMLCGMPGEEITVGDFLIRPDVPTGGIHLVSPYLPPGVQVKIRVTKPEIEYWAEENGLVEIEGEMYGTGGGLEKELQLSWKILRDHFPKCRSHPGKASTGKPVILYHLEDMRKLCATFLSLSPSGSDGLVDIDGEKYGTKPGLARELNVSYRNIRSRVSRCQSRPGKAPTGKPVILYNLEDMRKLCAPLLEKELSQVCTNKLVEIQEAMYGTVPSIATKLGVSGKVIRNRSSQYRSLPGKNSSGKPVILYRLEDVMKACADIIASKAKK